jgi:hypothetical protein
MPAAFIFACTKYNSLERLQPIYVHRERIALGPSITSTGLGISKLLGMLSPDSKATWAKLKGCDSIRLSNIFFFFQKKKQKALPCFAGYCSIQRNRDSDCILVYKGLLFPEKEAKSVALLRRRLFYTTESR